LRDTNLVIKTSCLEGEVSLSLVTRKALIANQNQ